MRAAPAVDMSTKTSFDPSQHPRGGNPANSGQWTEKRETDQGDGVLTAGGGSGFVSLVPGKRMFQVLAMFTAKEPGCENAILSGDWAYATDTYQAIRIRTGTGTNVPNEVKVEPHKAARMCQAGSRVTLKPWSVDIEGQPAPVSLPCPTPLAGRTETLFDKFTPVDDPQMIKGDELDRQTDDDRAELEKEYEQARQAAIRAHDMWTEEGLAAYNTAQDRLRVAQDNMTHALCRIGDRRYRQAWLGNAKRAMKALGYQTVEASSSRDGVLRLNGTEPGRKVPGGSQAEILVMPDAS